MGSPEVAPRNWDKWRHGAARLRCPRFARASVVRVWMHLAAVIFLLGGRRDEGLARESPAANVPSVSACARWPRQNSIPKRDRATANPTVWLRLPTAESLGLLTPDAVAWRDLRYVKPGPFAARRKFFPRGESIT